MDAELPGHRPQGQSLVSEPESSIAVSMLLNWHSEFKLAEATFAGVDRRACGCGDAPEPMRRRH
jgi:hypothetical protein